MCKHRCTADGHVSENGGQQHGTQMKKEHWPTRVDTLSKFSLVKAIEIILRVVSLHAEGARGQAGST